MVAHSESVQKQHCSAEGHVMVNHVLRPTVACLTMVCRMVQAKEPITGRHIKYNALYLHSPTSLKNTLLTTSNSIWMKLALESLSQLLTVNQGNFGLLNRTHHFYHMNNHGKKQCGLITVSVYIS